MRGARPDGAHLPNDIFVSTCLDLDSNPANLQKILCNSGVAVPLKLLAIKGEVSCDVDEDICENEKSNHNGLVCYINRELFAHIYITTENHGAFIKHYIIAFVEGTKIGRYDDLIDILYRTISWLKIENERPHFHIYYHGKYPVVGNTLNDARSNIVRKLKSRLNNYKPGESFCTTSRVIKDAVNFVISDSNPYKFNIS